MEIENTGVHNETVNIRRQLNGTVESESGVYSQKSSRTPLAMSPGRYRLSSELTDRLT
jgi:hypothetical protein